MKGILTSSSTGEVSEMELEYKVTEDSEGRRIFNLINGPTGYESFCMDNEGIFEDDAFLKSFLPNDIVERMSERGWLACAGSDSWDKLFIPAEEMSRVLHGI